MEKTWNVVMDVSFVLSWSLLMVFLIFSTFGLHVSNFEGIVLWCLVATVLKGLTASFGSLKN